MITHDACKASWTEILEIWKSLIDAVVITKLFVFDISWCVYHYSAAKFKLIILQPSNVANKCGARRPWKPKVKLNLGWRSNIAIIISYSWGLFYLDTQKNIERHTADTIVSLPNPKQWVIAHASDLMMIIRQSTYILSIITREMTKLKTYSPTYCIMDNGENMQQRNECDLQAKTYPNICTHDKLHNNNENKFPVFPDCICNKWQNMM